MKWGSAAGALCFAFVLRGAEPPSACVNCHPAETHLHERSRMAHAMAPAWQTSFAQNLPDQPLHESAGGYEFLFKLTPTGIMVTARRGNDEASGLIEWVMGSGVQGQTPLVRSAGSVLESRVSYFPLLHQYGITVGQEAGASARAVAALGIKENPRAQEACLRCHASATTTSLAGDLQPAIPGVQCVRCHPGANEHASGRGKPLNPGKLTAIQQVRFCGACHRNEPPVDDTQLENVRFQPLRLMKSKCFQSGQLACTTCHAAHQDARRNDAGYYNEKCSTCHSAATGVALHSDARGKGDCIGCHMPYVQLHPALKFTDHYIRVVKAGDLPPEVLRKRGIG